MKAALIDVRLPVKQKERSERMLLRIHQKKEMVITKCERPLSHYYERPAKSIGENENRYGDIRGLATID